MRHNNKTIFEELKLSENKIIYKWCSLYFYEDDELLDIKPNLVEFSLSKLNYVKIIFIDQKIEDLHRLYYDEITSNISKVGIFDTEQECNDFYNNQIWEEIKDLEWKSKFYIKKAQDLKDNGFINSDYIMEKLRRNN